MREIPLTQGQVALVDDEDYERLMQWKWHAQRILRTTFYARRADRQDGHRVVRLMHWDVMGIEYKNLIDHIDRDGLNNQKHNLRIVSPRNNQCNRTAWGKTSRYRGVSWDKKSRIWRTGITRHGSPITIGRFTSEEEAARAYDAAAIWYGGVYCLNFPEEHDATQTG